MSKYPLSLVAVAFLGGCVVAPPAPRVAVMPAPGKPFEQFTAEDRECRAWAEQSAGGNTAAHAQDAFLGSAAVGTAVGAVAGALMGGNRGAAAGAGVGLLFGSAAGSDQASHTVNSAQRRYDIAYQQCMYSKGNQIPGGSGYARAAPRASAAYPPPPPPNSGYPPPTADYPPSSYPPPPPQ